MKCKIFGLLFLWFALLPLAVQAQVQPTSGVIPFSGSMPGQPDGPVALRFRLFPAASGGTQCFEETQTVQVTTETFFAFVGDATTGGVPPDPCFTTNTSLWVAFALDEAPDTEIGARTSITSSGYAHFALGVTDNAVTTAKIQDMAVTGAKIEDSAITSVKIAASSVDSSKIVDGSIGASQVDSTQVQRRVIGSCDVGRAIQVVNADGTVACQAVGSGNISGIGTTNRIPKFTDANTLGVSGIFDSGGNIGIGTTNPGGAGLRVVMGGAGGQVGVIGESTAFAGTGVRGRSDFTGVHGVSTGGVGVFGDSTNGSGVSGQSSGGRGVIGSSTNSFGVEGGSTNNVGVRGSSTNNVGVRGDTSNSTQPGVVAASAGSSPANLGLLIFGRTGTTGKLRVDTSIPDDVPTYSFDVGNNTGNGKGISRGWDMFSSRRWKTNILTIQGALEKVERLRGVSFDWKENGGHDIGLIAEEVGEVVPEVVGYEENGKDARSVDYARLTAVLIEAVKEQQSQIRGLKAELEELKARRTETASR